MKYLAVLLGVLCAASAHCSGKYKFVPTRLVIDYNVEEAAFGTILNGQQEVDLSNPSITLKMTRENDTGANLPITYRTSAHRTDPATISSVGPSSGVTAFRFTPNTFAWVTMKVTDPLTYGSTPTMSLPDKPMYWPPTPNRQDQSILVQCAVPEYVTSNDRGFYWAWETMTLAFDTGAYDVPLNASATCRYYFEIVPEIKIVIKNGNMHLTGVSGTPILATNQLVATGWGGSVPASLRIDNPYKEELSISFSQTDFDQTTTTVKPTETGAQTDFYVKVNNTTPGSREYRVNFTAQFV